MNLWARKFWHLLGTLIPIIYYFSHFSQKLAAFITFCLFLCALLIDALRLLLPPFNRWFLNHFSTLFKKGEYASLTSTVYYLAAVTLTIYIFPKKIAICALLYLTLGDPIAAIAGYYIPLKRIWQTKTLGGSLSNFLVCCLLTLFFYHWPIAILGASAAVLSELFSPIDDALTIPLVSGLLLYLLV